MFLKILLGFITVSILYFGNVHASNRTDAENILNDVFREYNPEIQPFYNKTMDMSLSYLLFTLIEFDEVTGILSTVSGIVLNWTDPRLQWDPLQYNGLDYLRVPSTKTWYPELFCLNQADKLERIGDDTFGGVVFSDGRIMRILGTLLKTSCDVDMTYFPFDTQVCRLQFSTWGYSSYEIRMTENGISSDFLRENPRWVVLRYDTFDEQLGTTADSVVVEITIKRRPNHFVVTTLIPIVMLLFLNPFVFVLPVESGERTSYTVTIFLSQVVFMTLVGQNMPNSANPMARISYFVLVAMAFSILQTLTTIALMGLTFANPQQKAPRWLIKLMTVTCQCCMGMKPDRNMSTVQGLNVNQENSIDRRISCDKVKTDYKITLDKVAKALSRVAFVVSICIVLVIVISLLIALNV